MIFISGLKMNISLNLNQIFLKIINLRLRLPKVEDLEKHEEIDWTFAQQEMVRINN